MEMVVMMKLSTRSRYGARLLLDLAIHGDKGAISLGTTAARQGVSEKYLWQVAAALKTAQMVEAVRGAAGGYRLARPLRSITLKDVVAALDGEVDPAERAEPVGTDRVAAGVMRDAWREAGRGFEQALEAITLEDLADRHRAKSRKPTMDFTI
jgi:Rrf2 family protein